MKTRERFQQARAAKWMGGYYNNAFAIFRLYQCHFLNTQRFFSFFEGRKNASWLEEV